MKKGNKRTVLSIHWIKSAMPIMTSTRYSIAFLHGRPQLKQLAAELNLYRSSSHTKYDDIQTCPYRRCGGCSPGQQFSLHYNPWVMNRFLDRTEDATIEKRFVSGLNRVDIRQHCVPGSKENKAVEQKWWAWMMAPYQWTVWSLLAKKVTCIVLHVYPHYSLPNTSGKSRGICGSHDQQARKLSCKLIGYNGDFNNVKGFWCRRNYCRYFFKWYLLFHNSNLPLKK